MLSEEIEPTIMVATSENLYLIYDCNHQYYLGVSIDDNIKFSHFKINADPLELMELIDDSTTIDEIIKKSNNDKNKLEKDLTFLQSQIKSKVDADPNLILYNLLDMLANIQYEIREYGLSSINDDIIKGLENGIIIDKLKEISSNVKAVKDNTV